MGTLGICLRVCLIQCQAFCYAYVWLTRYCCLCVLIFVLGHVRINLHHNLDVFSKRNEHRWFLLELMLALVCAQLEIKRIYLLNLSI